MARLRDIFSIVGDEVVSAVLPDQLSNPNLKWETTYQSNFGIDISFLDNRINATLDYYSMLTEDVILGDNNAPEYIGFLTPDQLKNVGEISNKGFEFTLNTRNIIKEDFSWSTDFNFAINRNKVNSLIGGNDLFLDSAPGHFLLDETHILREGEAVGVFFGYEFRGVNQGGTLPAGTASFDGEGLGDELFTDVNGDGEITTDDRKIIGDPNPDFVFGLNNTFRYKDFDFNLFFQGQLGGDIFSYTLLELASGESNATTEVLNAWTPSNTNTNVPQAAVRGKRMSSRFAYDASYVRLKNLAVGYNIPSDITSKFGVTSARIGLSAQNILTLTDFPGSDVEAQYQATGNLGGNTNLGFDYGSYPNISSVTFSLNLTF